MKAKEKIRVLGQYIVNRLFVCPQCEMPHTYEPEIENISSDYDNEDPQIYCSYGCGYMFLPEKKEHKGRGEWWKEYINY